jgi:polyisoprenoid-binding protein YceI
MSTTTTTTTEQRTRWTVDPAASSVEFDIKTFWGLATVHGTFDRFEGWYETGPGGTAIELTIDADSFDTGNSTRDRHLRSAAFFGVADHPHVRFVSTRITHLGDGAVRVIGRLEAAGSSVELDFPAAVRLADGGLEIEARTTVDHRDLGMESGTLGMIRPPATLHLTAHLSK